MPAYWALCERYATEVFPAPQPAMFGGEYETRTQREWLRFAVGYLRERRQPLASRMVLQTTVGWPASGTIVPPDGRWSLTCGTTRSADGELVRRGRA